jgi:hypothetical protein
MIAVSALAAVLGSAAGADDAAGGSRKIEDPARVGHPGGTERTREMGGTAAGTRQLSGTVVKADAGTLYLEHMGAIVPLKIDDETEFSGEGVKSSRDLTEGQEVRASFTVKNETTNVADRIAVASASGRAPAGTGSQGTPPGGTERRPRPPVPSERGPGIPPDTQPIPRDPGTTPPRDPGGPPIKY